MKVHLRLLRILNHVVTIIEDREVDISDYNSNNPHDILYAQVYLESDPAEIPRWWDILE